MDGLLGFLSNSIWEIVSITIAIIGLSLAIARKKRKRISYEIITNTSIVSAEEGVNSDVEVLFQSKRLSNPGLVVLRIWNSGNTDISKKDFQKDPIKFKFAGANVLKIDDIVNNINASLTPSGETVSLAPILLNKKEAIKFKVLLDRINNIIEEPTVSSNIRIVKQSGNERGIILNTILSIILVIIALIFITNILFALFDFYLYNIYILIASGSITVILFVIVFIKIMME